MINLAKIKIDKELEDSFKKIFSEYIPDILDKSIRENTELGKKLRIYIPNEFIIILTDKNLMNNITNYILPKVFDSKGRFIDLVKFNKKNKYINCDNWFDKSRKIKECILEQRLENINYQLEIINFSLDSIKKGQQNDRRAKVLGAIEIINQSKLESDIYLKKQLEISAQSFLNEGIAAIKMDINDIIDFLMNWDKKGPIEKQFNSFIKIFPYSPYKIEENINFLCENLYYYKKAIISLIELKKCQGLDSGLISAFSILNDYDDMFTKIEEAKINNWLPPMDEDNKWKYEVLKKCDIDLNDGIQIEYVLD